jgi:hypothetical protein
MERINVCQPSRLCNMQPTVLGVCSEGNLTGPKISRHSDCLVKGNFSLQSQSHDRLCQHALFRCFKYLLLLSLYHLSLEVTSTNINW